MHDLGLGAPSEKRDHAAIDVRVQESPRFSLPEQVLLGAGLISLLILVAAALGGH